MAGLRRSLASARGAGADAAAGEPSTSSRPAAARAAAKAGTSAGGARRGRAPGAPEDVQGASHHAPGAKRTRRRGGAGAGAGGGGGVREQGCVNTQRPARSLT